MVARVINVYLVTDPLNALKEGPIGVYVQTLGNSFKAYGGGIFDGACSTEYDHACTAVGYGNENGTDYWILRNTWSE